ncbi:hypothetical protein ACPV5R_18715 [Vibrio astriarenae]
MIKQPDEMVELFKAWSAEVPLVAESEPFYVFSLALNHHNQSELLNKLDSEPRSRQVMSKLVRKVADVESAVSWDSIGKQFDQLLSGKLSKEGQVLLMMRIYMMVSEVQRGDRVCEFDFCDSRFTKFIDLAIKGNKPNPDPEFSKRMEKAVAARREAKRPEFEEELAEITKKNDELFS